MTISLSELRAARAKIRPGWRKEPPTADEVRVQPWWWLSIGGGQVVLVMLDPTPDGDVEVAAVWRLGEGLVRSAGVPPLFILGSNEEIAPCLPPL